MNVPVEMQKGKFGQFEVHVDGKMVASRKGGLIAKFTNRPWPDPDELVETVRSAMGSTR